MSYPSIQTPWAKSPFFEEELTKYQLTPANKALVRHFAEHGYVIIDPEIDELFIVEALASTKPEFKNQNTNRLENAWQRHKTIRKTSAGPRVLAILELLYQRKPIPFQTLNFSTGSQ
ncbi:hypothetical protein [Siphonobacter sp. SORGH_AS_1065]|uniref:hypothetical protein n=1 Tax=Siphonobacter sp. SORGH_AS_1065 TaxID=3041795 RepID=UPI0027866C8F|nr:hypothetical protein [Siphonobacter sp. SORGH_AS_1065]MDQ1086422.1 chromatin segregation and condensation protein Rec8/ScpA/Scc1 (kleisin family) [Siphonobacter sp. SORGH_AS_1065]